MRSTSECGSERRSQVPSILALWGWLGGAVVVIVAMAAVPIGFAAGGLGFSWAGSLIRNAVAIGAASQVLTAPVAIWRLLKSRDAAGREWIAAIVGWTTLEWMAVVVFLRWISQPFPV